MRQATITIRWEGPDKKVREFIEEQVGGLFYDLTMAFGDKLTFADGSTEFESKI